MIISQRASKIYLELLKEYPSVKSSLNFSTEQEIWASVILSAQCTDKRVNIVTKALFKKYKTFEDYSNSNIDELKKIIHTTGFYNSKAKYLQKGAKIIIEKYQSKLPSTTNNLTLLPGVGKKVANVILSEWFKKNEGIAVDTHNKRLAKRIGLSKSSNPVVIEKDMKKLFPKKDWNKISLLLIEHGRNVCKASKPECNKCLINKYCKYFESLSK